MDHGQRPSKRDRSPSLLHPSPPSRLAGRLVNSIRTHQDSSPLPFAATLPSQEAGDAPHSGVEEACVQQRQKHHGTTASPLPGLIAHGSLSSSGARSSDDAPHHQPPPEAGPVAPVVFSNGAWQAIYDPQHAAYYYANSKTGQITWQNPFLSSQTGSPPSVAQPLQPPLDLNGIDPELAHLDPSTSRLLTAHTSTHSAPTFAGRFNSKTGRFESDPTHDPSRVSEYARARAQASAYFDVEGWEKSLERNHGKVVGTSRGVQAEAVNRNTRLSKEELNRFREKKMEKKARRQRAWLAGS